MPNQFERPSSIIVACKSFCDDALKAAEAAIDPENHGEVAIVTLTTHIIEYLDGIGILVSQGSVLPCYPLLRSVFDSMLGLMYLLEADTNHRGLAYFYFQYKQEMAYWEHFDPATTGWRSVKAELATDIGGINAFDLEPLSVSQVQQLLAEGQAMLDDPVFSVIAAEWTKLKSQKKYKKRDPEWYSLFDGPTSLSALAKHLNYSSGYGKLFAPWSRHLHGTNTLITLSTTTDAIIHRPVRHSEGLDNIVDNTCKLAITIAARLFERYDRKNTTIVCRYKDLETQVRTFMDAYTPISWS